MMGVVPKYCYKMARNEELSRSNEGKVLRRVLWFAFAS
jgi:hypothetical protein